MPKISLLNMCLGFVFIFLSASAGLFLSTEHVRAHVEGGAELLSWWMQLSTSAHGHTNLFGVLHILLGLTFPYAFKHSGIRLFQTIGLLCGSLSMSFLMYLRALGEPSLEYDLIGIFIGAGLGLSLTAIGLQVLGIGSRLTRS